MKSVQGRVIQSGYDWTMRIRFRSEGISFPSNATFVAHVRRDPDVEDLLVELSTANGNIERLDDKTIDIIIPGTASADWPKRKVYIDIARTDEEPAIHLGFRLVVPVQRPITRLP